MKILPIVLLAALCAASCAKQEVAAKAANPEPAAPPGAVVLSPDAPELKQITIEAVKTISMASDEVTSPAKIEVNPNRVARAALPVPGRIVRVMVKLGDSVIQGQPVVTIESPSIAEAESNFSQSETSVRQADLAIAKADADLSRLQDLFEHQAVAKKDVLAAQTTLALAKSSLEQAQSVREQARRRLELLGLKPGQSQQQVTVTAPISGKVMEIDVVEGELHNEINAPLLKIADLSRVWVSSQVPESAIRYCKVGGLAELELIAYPNEMFRARVTRIADTVDPDSRTIKVTAELDNPAGRLRPEMFGRLSYADAVMPMVWIPESAVVQFNGKDTVLVEQSVGHFQATPVELGRRHLSGFAVKSGLTAGQRIITSGAVYLKAGL